MVAPRVPEGMPPPPPPPPPPPLCPDDRGTTFSTDNSGDQLRIALIRNECINHYTTWTLRDTTMKRTLYSRFIYHSCRDVFACKYGFLLEMFPLCRDIFPLV
jgi:hypothetical protein